MNFHVIPQLGLKTISLVTSRLRALVSVLADVETLVLVEISVLSEAFGAEFTFVRLFTCFRKKFNYGSFMTEIAKLLTCMRSDVTFQMVRRVKSHFAELALKVISSSLGSVSIKHESSHLERSVA